MISSSAELYALVRQIADDLRRVGEKQWASLIENALLGSSSSEILHRIWLQLHKLKSSGQAQAQHLSQMVEQVIAWIDQVLGPRDFDDTCKCDEISYLQGMNARMYAECHLRERVHNSWTEQTLFECPVTGRLWKEYYPGYPSVTFVRGQRDLIQIRRDDAELAFEFDQGLV